MSPNPYQPSPYVKLQHPAWSKNATIYQINTRQFTQEGTFRAAESHLPRLKELGAVILWVMPINEIGVQNRKGSLGSPYSVKDYYSVNPEFGTLDDLKHFVQAAHNLGMYVIIDWVANHTSWDNRLVTEHPEWLFALKKTNTALWNGKWGATMIHVPNSSPAAVLSFVRRNASDNVFAVLNFSAEPQTVLFSEHLHHGIYTEYFSQASVELTASSQLALEPWGYRVYVQA